MTATIHSKHTLFHTRVFKLVEENITLENGINTTVNIIRHPGAAGIVPITGRDTVILIKQYRHALSDFIWEIPAGTRDANEDPLACAKRELTEETGYIGHRWHKLGDITPVPGYSDERVHLFLADDLTQAVQNLDRDELLNVHKVPFSEALEMIHKGTIQDGKTICGLYMAANYLRNGYKRLDVSYFGS